MYVCVCVHTLHFEPIKQVIYRIYFIAKEKKIIITIIIFWQQKSLKDCIKVQCNKLTVLLKKKQKKKHKTKQTLDRTENLYLCLKATTNFKIHLIWLPNQRAEPNSVKITVFG